MGGEKSPFRRLKVAVFSQGTSVGESLGRNQTKTQTPPNTPSKYGGLSESKKYRESTGKEGPFFKVDDRVGR